MIEQQEAARMLADLAATRIEGDVAALTQFFHDDAQFKIVGLGEAVRGKASLRATLQGLIDQYAFLEWRQICVTVHGDQVAARHRLKMRHSPSGKVYETETAEFVTMKDGKVASFVQFADTALIGAMGTRGA